MSLVGWMLEFGCAHERERAWERILYASLSNNKSVYFKNEIGKPCSSEIAENSGFNAATIHFLIHTAASNGTARALA